MAAGAGVGGASGAGGASEGSQPSHTVEVEDRFIGKLVGKGGSVLNDLKSRSGTNIKISQRGDYAPGTTNR